MQFHVIDRGTWPPQAASNSVYLRIDYWNDYSFVTSFEVIAFDQNGKKHELPSVRIGFPKQTIDTPTYKNLPRTFDRVPPGFFSLGISVDYYRTLFRDFDVHWRRDFLDRLCDVVFRPDVLEKAKDEEVFKTSFLRSVSLTEIKDQYVSVLSGDVSLTDFEFGFILPQSPSFAGFDLTFEVKANSLPSSNMHALIGRNGVGKTTLLNSMVRAIVEPDETRAHFYTPSGFGNLVLPQDYFSSIVSVAYSAFDPFDLPAEDERGRYSYIGMTDYSEGDDGAIIKSQRQIINEFVAALEICLSDEARKNRWLTTITILQSDDNFADMNLSALVDLPIAEREAVARRLFIKMSSGHSVVILTMTQLVARLQERTLVLIDEPESHLHPPLLSAMIRSLSQLLHSRNAVAIIATHSPVVLQEVPRSCVWKVFRSKLASKKKRPDTETFGENVGTLTREAFGLEVERSGFHTVLAEMVELGGSYDDIIRRLGGSLGNEAKGILRALVINRDEN
ncbi:AAA family ATPase [uncultured Sphingomonas sp.]|uniref:AAA family ATPase n=1 Tax=uncultured Sphingomonas sp. TaxID=158754 RepID=UPI0025CB8BF6|nr:AAA family ATPase [uncultured Sphingomonas sp.]